MKFLKLIVTILLGIAIFGTANSFIPKSSDSEKITKNVEIESFSKLDVSGVFNIYLSQGGKESLRMEGDEEYLDLIEVENKGSKLVISMKNNRKLKVKNVKLYLTIVDVDDMSFSIVGNVRTEDQLNLDELSIDMEHVGNTYFDIICDKLDIDIASVGNTEIIGKINDVKIDNAAVGKLDASNLLAKNLELDNSSIGKVRVYASERLEIESNGIGSVYYSGNPEYTDIDHSGIGKVKKE